MTFPISADGTTGFFPMHQQVVRRLDNLSIITRYKNRKQHLLTVLPSWLALPVAEIVIVDWSSDHDLSNFLKYIDDPRVKVVRVEKKDDFDRSAAWNLGIANSSFEWVMLLDADLKLINPGFFNDPVFCSKNYDIFWRFFADKDMPQMFGSSILLKDQWAAVGGFNESMVGWGWEDVDFYGRMAKRYQEKTLPLGAFAPQNHDDDYRTFYHKEKDLRFSSLKNAYRAKITKKLELHFEPGIITKVKDITTCATAYKQSRVVEWDAEPMLASQRFSDLAKRFNVFTSPKEQEKLFQEEEFLALESEFRYGKPQGVPHSSPMPAPSLPSISLRTKVVKKKPKRISHNNGSRFSIEDPVL